VLDGSGASERIDTPFDGIGLRFQFDEVEACLDAGATQRAVMPWAETLRLAALMDDIRALIGMRYDADALDAGRA
jgi:hypothetical protein